jgi:uncharacterized repeat protein (TIGR01451 family)
MQAPQNNFAPPNGAVTIPLQFGNNGATTASSVTVTATLSSGLTYIGDTSGITPAQNTLFAYQGDSAEDAQYTWDFSTDMAFLGNGQFDLYVGIGDVEIGNSYPVTVTISTAESDGNTNDNVITLYVVVVQQNFLPLVRR